MLYKIVACDLKFWPELENLGMYKNFGIIQKFGSKIQSFGKNIKLGQKLKIWARI